MRRRAMLPGSAVIALARKRSAAENAKIYHIDFLRSLHFLRESGVKKPETQIQIEDSFEQVALNLTSLGGASKTAYNSVIRQRQPIIH